MATSPAMEKVKVVEVGFVYAVDHVVRKMRLTMTFPTFGTLFAADRSLDQVRLTFQFATVVKYFFVTFLKMTFVCQVF